MANSFFFADTFSAIYPTPMAGDRLIDGGLTLQKRWGYPEDVGKAVLALTEGNFQYSTGQIINVDGGLMMQRL